MDQLDKKEVVQAVIIADNYNDCFKPFTDTKPMVDYPPPYTFPDISSFFPFTFQGLLPLVNVPVLDYVLESLNRCGVEEVFIYSSCFIEQIRSHVK